MCNGISINGERCYLEIQTGNRAGECTKKSWEICPDTLEDEEIEDDDERE